jgi:DNA-binding Lrp family transcriptional regulator
MRKDLPNRLLIELLGNSKESDRKLAKRLKVSQPTITRTRGKLEREGFIRSYTILPNWKKLGFEIFALTFVKMHSEVVSEELFTKLKKYAEEFPSVFFASRGQGLGMTGVIMSMHKDYRDYAKKLAIFRQDWAKHLETLQSFVMVTDEGLIKEFSFKYLGEALL